MKPPLVYMAFVAVTAFAGTATAEYRVVLVTVKVNVAGKIVASIGSDEKEERRKDVTVEEAAKVVAGMKGWGSTVGVYIIPEGVGSFASKPLLRAICDNHWLELVYLGPDLPKHLAEHFARLQKEP